YSSERRTVGFGKGRLETQVTLCAGRLLHFLLFADDRHCLWQWRAAIIEYLAGLRLKLHENRAQPRPVTEGLPFLGFVVYPAHRRLKRRKGIFFQRRLKQRLAAYRQGEITFAQLDASVRGWVNHARHGDTWELRRAILGQVSIPPACIRPDRFQKPVRSSGSQEGL
ncbi:MAG: hypothetical protein JXM69_18185, partial [Anaerolineae bacterium]|nr:hypothetical protein [Anaerolineae bacterium]